MDSRRILEPGGRLIIGFVDRDSGIGRDYLAHQAESTFYRNATFFSADDVERLVEESGLVIGSWVQTLGRPLAETRDIEAAWPGRGTCAFVVVDAYNEK